MSDLAAYVHLADGKGSHGTLVGAVAAYGSRGNERNQIVFEYAPEYRGESISPIMLPTTTLSRTFEFPELSRQPAFDGLPGVLADCLPDRFGTRLIESYFRSKGVAPRELSPVQKLLYIGNRGMGALTFHPAINTTGEAQIEAVALGQLRQQAQQVLQGAIPTTMPQIMDAASSAGGARAKVLLFWNPKNNDVAIGHETPDGYEPWLVKLDGVASDGSSQPWTRIERAYGLMAVAAGLDVPEQQLLMERDHQHFGVRRFDRTPDGRRLHYHSLAGLQHADHNDRQLIGYDMLLQSCLDLHLGVPALTEAYRRMVFNVVARNQDDHTKNVGFLMDPITFRWSLAPAFDLCFAADSPWTDAHQMTINGKARGIEREDLLAVANQFHIDTADDIIDRTVAVVADGWPSFAGSVDVPESMIEAIGKRHRLHLERVTTNTQTRRQGMRL